MAVLGTPVSLVSAQNPTLVPCLEAGVTSLGSASSAQRGGASLEKWGAVGPSRRGWNAHPPLLCTPPQTVCVARRSRPHPYPGRDSEGHFISTLRHPTRKTRVRNEAAASSCAPGGSLLLLRHGLEVPSNRGRWWGSWETTSRV